MIDGRERRVYRVREPDQLRNDDRPTMMVALRTKIPPSSACVVESENSDVKLSLDTACFLVKNPRLPAGLRLDPFVSTKLDNGLFRIVIVNETNHTIYLPRYTILGHVVFEPPTLIASCSTKPTTIDPAILEASLPDVAENIKSELRSLLLENQSICVSNTRSREHRPGQTRHRHAGARANPPKAIQGISSSTGDYKENHRRTTRKRHYTTFPLPLGGPNSVSKEENRRRSPVHRLPKTKCDHQERLFPPSPH